MSIYERVRKLEADNRVLNQKLDYLLNNFEDRLGKSIDKVTSELELVEKKTDDQKIEEWAHANN